MTKTEIRMILEEARKNKLICNVCFKYAPNYLNLIPLICGERLVVFAQENDFILDGYCVRQIKDIKKLKAKNNKSDEILRNEGIISVSPAIEIGSWYLVFESLKNRNKNIIVEHESLDDNDEEFVIGRIIKINKKTVFVLHFDADGVWEEEPTEIPFNEITSVTFNSRYIEVFSKYIDEPITNGLG